MKSDIIIIDKFYEDPESVRRYGLQQRYYYPYETDADVKSGQTRFSWMASWFREAHECPFKSSKLLHSRLQEITGDEIDLSHWNLSFPRTAEGKAVRNCSEIARSCLWNCSFHFKPNNRKALGEGVHNHVTDVWNGVGRNGWAGVIYLSHDAPISGGLKLWRNHDPKRTLDWMTAPENWELVDNLGNIYNRLILCRGGIPHSGANGWGDKLENGRFYQTFFFQVKESKVMESLRIPL